MPNVITGNPANITTPLTRTVTGAVTAGGLIKLTTSVAHLFATSDVVTVQAVGGVPAANGTWTITVVDATHFTLDGSTFAGVYTSGGTATDYSLTPAFNIIADGENMTADTFAVTAQALADRTQYLATLGRRTATVITVTPAPFNVSYAADWLVGDDGTGSSTGHLLVKSVPNDNTVFVDLTPLLVNHAGRTLVSCNPVLAVGQSHANVPTVLPSAGVFKTQSLTTLGVAPSALVSLIAASLVSFPTPVSGAAYYDSGHLQTWTVATDQNKVIDASARYLAALIDESGTNSMALNKYYGFRLTIQ